MLSKKAKILPDLPIQLLILQSAQIVPSMSKTKGFMSSVLIFHSKLKEKHYQTNLILQ